jgi:[ribosomal protein S18]-alanine N-acetyltransferase
MGKRPVGYVMLARSQGEGLGPRLSELLAIAVEAGARRWGIGDLLMREMIRKAEELLVKTLILYTAVDNLPAQALFKKHGFAPAGVKKGFYPEGQSALLMQKEIS